MYVRASVRVSVSPQCYYHSITFTALHYAELTVQYAWLLLYSSQFELPQHLTYHKTSNNNMGSREHTKKNCNEIRRRKMRWNQKNASQSRGRTIKCGTGKGHSVPCFPLFCSRLSSLAGLINVHQSSSRITFILKLIHKCLFYPSVFMMMMMMMLQRDKFAHLHTFHKSFDEWYCNRFAHLWTIHFGCYISWLWKQKWKRKWFFDNEMPSTLAVKNSFPLL